MSNEAPEISDVSGLPVIPRTQTGKDPNTGQPVYNYNLAPLDDWAAANGYDEEHPIPIAGTGPATSGIVKLGDGTLYDITDHFIITQSDEHAREIHHHVALQLERTGRHDTGAHESPDGKDVKYRHTDCQYCDAPATEHLVEPAARTAVASGRKTYLAPVPVSQAAVKKVAK